MMIYVLICFEDIPPISVDISEKVYEQQMQHFKFSLIYASDFWFQIWAFHNLIFNFILRCFDSNDLSEAVAKNSCTSAVSLKCSKQANVWCSPKLST